MRILSWILLLAGCAACSTPTPKPRGVLRIDLPQAKYTLFTAGEQAYAFRVSQLVTIEMPPADVTEDWLNVTYPSLNVKMYCSYRSITRETLPRCEAECRELVARSARDAQAITEQAYEAPERRVYGMLFRIDGDSPSPVQFMLTDSVSHFFRGAIYYQHRVDADSVAPVTEYLHHDVMQLIQSFDWK